LGEINFGLSSAQTQFQIYIFIASYGALKYRGPKNLIFCDQKQKIFCQVSWKFEGWVNLCYFFGSIDMEQWNDPESSTYDTALTSYRWKTP